MKLREQLRPFTLLDVNGLGDTKPPISNQECNVWWENKNWFSETLDSIEARGFKILEELRK